MGVVMGWLDDLLPIKRAETPERNVLIEVQLITIKTYPHKKLRQIIAWFLKKARNTPWGPGIVSITETTNPNGILMQSLATEQEWSEQQKINESWAWKKTFNVLEPVGIQVTMQRVEKKGDSNGNPDNSTA